MTSSPANVVRLTPSTKSGEIGSNRLTQNTSSLQPDTKIRPSERQSARIDEPALASAEVAFFSGIDILRALAAVIILIWRYQHFYFTAETKIVDGLGVIDRTVQPLYWLLYPIYLHGYWAVGFFWAISGFVFSKVYAGRETPADTFAVARFARLYPLHLVTLITIACLQILSWNLLGLKHQAQRLN